MNYDAPRNKQLNLLYFSATGTTARIVREVARGIGGSVKEYDVTLPDSRQKSLFFGSDDLVIFAVPVYFGRVPDFLIDYFGRVQGEDTPAVVVVVYGNRHYDDALLELKDTLEAKGFTAVAGAAFIGEHSIAAEVAKGRPDSGDLEIALKFGMEIKAVLSNKEEAVHGAKLAVKGNLPYKEKKSLPPIAPETSDMCTQCGVCAADCPVSAINFHTFIEIDATKCIKCCRCVKRCPVGAKALNHELINKVRQFLIENFSTVRHEPEIFL